MIKSIYALYDKQTKAFQNPISFLNHGDAIRWLTTISNPQNNQEPSLVSLYPEQFILFHVADYDDETGQFTNTGAEVIHAQQVKNETEKYTLKDIFEKFTDFKNTQ